MQNETCTIILTCTRTIISTYTITYMYTLAGPQAHRSTYTTYPVHNSVLIQKSFDSLPRTMQPSVASRLLPSLWASGIRSSTTTYTIAPAAKESA